MVSDALHARPLLLAAVLLHGLAVASRAAPWDMPCEIGPFSFRTGDLVSGPNGPPAGVKGRQAMVDYRDELQQLTLYREVEGGLLALNPADGFSHNQRVHAGIDFTFYEFDERNGSDIAEIRANVAVLDVAVQFGDRRPGNAYQPKRGSRVGVRLPYVDYLDRDPLDGRSESGLFDPQVYADIGIAIDREDDSFLTGLILQGWVTLPTGDDEKALGRDDFTLGLRPRWFLRWVPREAQGAGVRLTQLQFSAGAGYAWDTGVSDNSFWSPVVGLWLGWNDRVFVELELEGRLHESGVDQYDARLETSFRLLPETGSRQVFLSVGAIVALNDEGLRDSFAPTLGVTFAFGQRNP